MYEYLLNKKYKGDDDNTAAATSEQQSAED